MTLDLHVDHGALDGAALAMHRTVADIGARLDRLASELAPLRSDWTGRAQDACTAAQAAWDRAVHEMKDLLAETQAAVTQSNLDYQAADRRGAAQFGG